MKTENTNSLIRLIGDFGITLPKNAIEWRVARSPEGSAGQPGTHCLHGRVTMLVTDGIVSWFLLGDHQTLFFGHKSNFEPEASESLAEARPRFIKSQHQLDEID